MTAPELVTEIAALPLIDLNGDRRDERRQVFRRSQRFGLAILATAVAAAAILVPLTLQAAALQGVLGTSEGHARQVRSRLKTLTAASAQLDTQISLWERLKQTQQSRRTWGSTLPSLAACLPPDVVLQRVRIAAEDSDVTLHLEGSAGSMTGLRAFTTALEASPVFAQVHLDDAAADGRAGHKGLSFRLTGPITAGTASGTP